MSRFLNIGAKPDTQAGSSGVAESAIRRVDKMHRELGHHNQRIDAKFAEMYEFTEAQIEELRQSAAQKCTQCACGQQAPTAPQHTTTVVREQVDLTSINVQLTQLADQLESLDVDLMLVDESVPDVSALNKEIANLKYQIKISCAVGLVLLVISFII